MMGDDAGNDVDPGLLTALEAQELVDNLETFLRELGFRSVGLNYIFETCLSKKSYLASKENRCK